MHITLQKLTHWALRCGSDFISIMFKLIIHNTCCEITVRWMPLNITNQKSTFVHVMAWCQQTPSHYLNQCWPRSLSQYVVTRPHCIRPTISKKFPAGSQPIWFFSIRFVFSQYSAVPLITRTIFSWILTKDTPLLAGKGEVWGVFCEFNLWLSSVPVPAVLYTI